MESGVLAVGKSCFAVEVGHSAVGFDLKTVDFDGLAVASAGSAVEMGVCAVDKESAAVGGGSSPVESGGRTDPRHAFAMDEAEREIAQGERVAAPVPRLIDLANRLRHAVVLPRIKICENVAGASRSGPLSGRPRPILSCEFLTADEQDGRRLKTQIKTEFPLCLSAFILFTCG